MWGGLHLRKSAKKSDLFDTNEAPVRESSGLEAGVDPNAQLANRCS